MAARPARHARWIWPALVAAGIAALLVGNWAGELIDGRVLDLELGSTKDFNALVNKVGVDDVESHVGADFLFIAAYVLVTWLIGRAWLAARARRIAYGLLVFVVLFDALENLAIVSAIGGGGASDADLRWVHTFSWVKWALVVLLVVVPVIREVRDRRAGPAMP
jgi:hypothetical protein